MTRFLATSRPFCNHTRVLLKDVCTYISEFRSRKITVSRVMGIFLSIVHCDQIDEAICFILWESSCCEIPIPGTIR